MRHLALPAILLAMTALACATGCGYSTRRLEGLGGRTIAVRPFENLTYRRDLELRLTEQLLVELRGRTSYGLAPLASADYVIEGRVAAGEDVGLQRADRSVVQEQFRVYAHVLVKDRRSGRVVKEFDAFAVTEFTPDMGGESLQGSATHETLRRLAIRIGQGLEQGF